MPSTATAFTWTHFQWFVGFMVIIASVAISGAFMIAQLALENQAKDLRSYIEKATLQQQYLRNDLSEKEKRQDERFAEIENNFGIMNHKVEDIKQSSREVLDELRDLKSHLNKQ